MPLYDITSMYDDCSACCISITVDQKNYRNSITQLF